MALNLKTFTTRALTAAVFVAVLLSGICLNFLSFAALFLTVSIWGLVEFYRIAEKLGARPYKGIGISTGVLLFSHSFLVNTNLVATYSFEKIMPVIFVMVFIIFIRALFDSHHFSVLNSVYTLAGLVYAVFPFTLLVHISCIDKTYTLFNRTGNWLDDFAPYNFHYVLGIILLIWASDVCAYIVGSLIGKNKLFERISPGKTWEGSIGAAILTIGCAFIIANWFPELPLIHWVVISILVCIFGTIGDLVESMLKRQASIKDSGSIMPGHGGILDRFDSLLFVAPFIYAYLIIVQSI
ncbi:MAG: phosphatidate cytidylyltransferase [Bacteroidota bacterium]|jgi:phosphatidate cytidylyltransferase|nr:phosphatidate cytidylyltransferase [Bacteroidota bacterium]